MLSQLTGKDQTDCGLNFSGRDGGTFVVMGKFGCLTGDTFENIIDEAVHDAHSLAGNSSVGVNLLENFVNVDCVALTSLSPPLPSLSCWLCGLGRLLGSLRAWFGWHVCWSWLLVNE